MSEISKTGYWKGETAHQHHYHCQPLSDWIYNLLKEDKNKKIVYDFGCGLGNYLKDLYDKGFSYQYLFGFEAEVPKKAVFEGIMDHDLTKPANLPYKGHVISLEVGEHIPSEHMDQYLDNICNNCDGYLITSWAVRGQEGFGHVNCLDNEEIIPEFEKRGFKYLPNESQSARDCIGDDFGQWFKNTLMIFRWDKNVGH